jgi:UDP-N-acetylmuramoylalanine--D-glutamate ligase
MPAFLPLTLPGFLQARLRRPVAILGAGVSGRGVRALLVALGAESATYDERDREFTAAAAEQHSLVVFSPGFPPDHPWLARARAAGGVCLSEVDFASLCWRGRIVAVTGTNGKTTLTEFLVHALGAAGRDAVATGNIGHSFSQLAADTVGGAATTVAVCEVSSFQAETLRYFHAEAALWTNFAEDHLERHDGLPAYFDAKAELLARSDVLFAGSSVRAYARQHPFAREGEARVVWVETEDQAGDPRLAGTPFADYPQRENFLLAAAWWRASGLDEAALYAAARTFHLGRHRLARVAEVGGVTWWNDSKATNFHAVEAALRRFPEPVLLIAGGKAKGGDLGAFVRRIAPRVRRIFLIGETALLLAAACADTGLPHAVCASLAEAVRHAAAAARPGEHVLLSPGFASFDLFHNYQDRGEQFERLVRARAPAAPAP